MIYLNIVLLLACAYTIGFYHGKGKIEVIRRYSKEHERKLLEEEAELKKEAEKQREELQEELNEIVRGGNLLDV